MDNAELEKLLAVWQDQGLAPEQTKQLKSLLKDPDNRAILFKYFQETASIVEVLKEENTVSESSKRMCQVFRSHSRQKNRHISYGALFSYRNWIAAAACVTLLTTAYIIFSTYSHADSRLTIATIDNAGKNVKISCGGAQLAASANQNILNGDTINVCEGEEATVKYTGTEPATIRIFGNSEVTFSLENGSKCVYLATGKLSAKVSPQLHGCAMTLTTPETKTSVIGTEFSLESRNGNTLLEVTKGKVQLVRKKDMQSIIVPSGNCVSADIASREPLTILPLEFVGSHLIFQQGTSGIPFDKTRACYFPDKEYHTNWRTNEDKGQFYLYGGPKGAVPVLDFPDLIGKAQGQLPPGAKVQKALLRLYVIESCWGGDKRNITAKRILDPDNLGPWYEPEFPCCDTGQGVCYEYRDSRSGHKTKWNLNGDDWSKVIDNAHTSCATVNHDDDNIWITLDVTEVVQAWAEGAPNQGWVFEMSKVDPIWFAAEDYEDATKRPKLEIFLK